MACLYTAISNIGILGQLFGSHQSYLEQLELWTKYDDQTRREALEALRTGERNIRTGGRNRTVNQRLSGLGITYLLDTPDTYGPTSRFDKDSEWAGMYQSWVKIAGKFSWDSARCSPDLFGLGFCIVFGCAL